MKHKGLLLVVSGPSGVGKGTLVKAYIQTRKDIFLSVSATTRTPREGEIEGVNYFFKTQEQFDQMVKNRELLEWVEFCGNCYGTPKTEIERLLDEGKDVLLEIEIQGALTVRRHYPEGVYIFLLPPDFETLKQRIIGRGSETTESLRARFERAKLELQTADKYNYVLINDTIEEAVKDLDAIIRAEKCRLERNKNFIDEVSRDVISFN